MLEWALETEHHFIIVILTKHLKLLNGMLY